jgi:hypothetical protein
MIMLQECFFPLWIQKLLQKIDGTWAQASLNSGNEQAVGKGKQGSTGKGLSH